MPSLTQHLNTHASHAALGFRRDCPRCRAERLQGPLPDPAVVPRRVQAGVVAGMVAASSSAPPAAALGKEGGGQGPPSINSGSAVKPPGSPQNEDSQASEDSQQDTDTGGDRPGGRYGDDQEQAPAPPSLRGGGHVRPPSAKPQKKDRSDQAKLNEPRTKPQEGQGQRRFEPAPNRKSGEETGSPHDPARSHEPSSQPRVSQKPAQRRATTPAHPGRSDTDGQSRPHSRGNGADGGLGHGSPDRAQKGRRGSSPSSSDESRRPEPAGPASTSRGRVEGEDEQRPRHRRGGGDAQRRAASDGEKARQTRPTEDTALHRAPRRLAVGDRQARARGQG